jgi:hypothetical protein
LTAPCSEVAVNETSAAKAWHAASIDRSAAKLNRRHFDIRTF